MSSPRLLAAMAASLVLVSLLVVLAGATPTLAQDYGSRDPDRRIYDRVGVLASAEVAALELHAERVEQAGAPVVVYLQAREASYEETERDARDLMEAWDVQSSAGARDGLVIFLNLEPDDTQHGQVALFAGERHYDGGRLPAYELERIYEDVMLPLLANGQLADGIRGGLDAAAESLTSGPPPPPPPSAAEQAASAFAREPLAVLSLLVLGGVVLVVVRTQRTRPQSRSLSAATIAPPGDLAPALAGALVKGRVGHDQIRATLLDLARRGALALEPSGRGRKVQVRLLDAGAIDSYYEQRMWDALSGSAGENGLVPDERMGRMLTGENQKSVSEALRADLRDRDWYDREAGSRRRGPMLTGMAALLVAAAGFIAALVGKEPWGFVWVGITFAAGIATISYAVALPETTQAGEDAAAPWRAYLAGLKSNADHVNLDEAMPYAVAMGATGTLTKRLEAASDQGYAPLWLGSSAEARRWTGGFYPYWVWFDRNVAGSSGSGGHVGAGGASVGGGGAGGRF